MKNPESCVINCGKTTPYFKLESETREGDPVLAYFLSIAFKVVFSLIKANPDTEGLQFFRYTFLYSVYETRNMQMKYLERYINFLFFLALKSTVQSVKLLALMSKRGLKWRSVEWNVSI